jgi:RHS repeat-associated protein
MLAHGGVSIVYDGDGNRVSETVGGTTTKYLVDDLNPTGLPQVLDEIVSTLVTRTYAYGLQRISENQLVGSTWTPSFYDYDGHGNVRFLTNSFGAITDSYDFDAFGMPVRTSGTTSNSFLYSGERYDSGVGLYDLRARYYNQATGRFWARDPIEGKKCCGLTWNPYIYVKDDPVNAVDPTGREALVQYAALVRNRAQAAVVFGTKTDICLLAALRGLADALSAASKGSPIPTQDQDIAPQLGVCEDNAIKSLLGFLLGHV